MGVNRILPRLVADARQAGHRLTEWRNEAESTRRVRDGDRTYWIRPDAGGSLWCREADAPNLHLLRHASRTHRAALYWRSPRLVTKAVIPVDGGFVAR